MFWRELKSFLYFRPKERRGIFVLSFFCIVLLVIKLNTGAYINQDLSFPEISERLDTLDCLDINAADEYALKKYGLSRKQVRTIINYREKVHSIDDWSDLEKLYNFDQKQLHALGNSVLWRSGSFKQESGIVQYDMNNMQREDFQKVFGLNYKLANRVVAYRRLLGGFYNLDQLCEVYFFPCDQLIKVSGEKINFSYSGVQQLSLNNSTFESLLRHPYLNKEQCSVIFKYRKKLKRKLVMEDIEKNPTFSNEDMVKLRAYLSD
jgi:DNA uptake protein ComE-like DNA-binding protein